MTTTGGLYRTARRWGRPAARAARRMRRRRELREAVETVRQARGMRLVLMYHRVVPRDHPGYEPVPTIPHHLFRDQINAFGDLARLEPLHTLLNGPTDVGEPLRLALTFDDDFASHTRYALPVLRDLGLHGTFFLSGRHLHGLGGYWFQRLEALLAERGLEATAQLLNLPGVSEAQLPLRCEGDLLRMALIEQHAPPGEAPLDAAGIRALSESGMSIGFHTLHHPVLTLLPDEEAREALTAGRDRLGAHVGRPLAWFAYPHGKVDARVLELTRQAGYDAAWTTQPQPLRVHDDRLRLGRWEPQPMPTDELIILFGRFLARMMG
jgi:peptidoglycan/xylan/chitin deacetylase (PgdA/CDA1 family)